MIEEMRTSKSEGRVPGIFQKQKGVTAFLGPSFRLQLFLDPDD